MALLLPPGIKGLILNWYQLFSHLGIVFAFNSIYIWLRKSDKSLSDLTETLSVFQKSPWEIINKVCFYFIRSISMTVNPIYQTKSIKFLLQKSFNYTVTLNIYLLTVTILIMLSLWPISFAFIFYVEKFLVEFLLPSMK